MPTSHPPTRRPFDRGDLRPRSRELRSTRRLDRLALSGLASFTLMLGLAGAALPATADHSVPSPATDEVATLGTDSPDDVEHGAPTDATDPSDRETDVDDATEVPAIEERDDASGQSQVDGAADAASVNEDTLDETPVGSGVSEVESVEPSATKSSDAEMIAPAAAGPDGGVPPFVYWTVEDAAGTPVGGATSEIQGPAATTGPWWWPTDTWGSSATVTDCVTAPCAGPDLDPDPGEFLVERFGNHDVDSVHRYRVRTTTAPSGYLLSGGTAWNEIRVGGSFATPERGAWQDRTYDFGSFPVRQLGSYAPTCAAGAVYGLSAGGYLREVASNGSVSNLGQQASRVSSFNGLGIGYGGETVYAYERTGTSAQPSREAAIWTFDTQTGRWSPTGHSVSSTASNGTRVQFVAGAVDLDTGKYYFGGFTPTSNQQQSFRIWEFDPSGGISYKGSLNTSRGAGGSSNGDMAFNAAGDLFVVRGSGTTTTVFSVTAENLQAAHGGTIPSSQSASFTTMDNVNGIAFDAEGKGYLGSSSQLRSYDMPGWTNHQTVVNSGLNSTDLASCSSPPTITLEKYVEGARVDAGDQFTLSLDQGRENLGTQTTVGNESGLQDVRVGPLPTVRNVELSFSETAAGSTSFANYVSSYACTLDGDPFTSGSGTTGSITIPQGGEEVVCTFRNAPLIANVTLYKFMADRDGDDAEPHPGWTVGMDAEPTAGSIRDVTPTASSQSTGPDGDASWTIRFDDHSARATVTVSEEMQDGFETAQVAVCSVNGTELTFEGTSHSIADVAPGDDISCAFTNRPTPATLQVDKEWIVDGEHYLHGDLPAGLTADLHLFPAGEPDDTPQWGQERTGLIIGDRVTINETTGIDDGPFPGCRLSDSTIVGPGLDEPKDLGAAGIEVTLAGATNLYTVTNVVTCQSLTLEKEVENGHGGTLTPADWDGGLFAQADGAPQLVFDSGATKYVATGTYALTEAAESGYELASLTCVGGTFDAGSGRVTIADGASVTCTFVNTDVPGSVTWAKVAEGTDEVRLAGSEWELTRPDGSTVLIADCVADATEECGGPDRDPADGGFRLVDLPWGAYALVETKAPPGYVRDTTTHTFTITANDLDRTVGLIANVQHEGPALPLTGGLGRDHVYLAGSLVLLLSLTFFGATRLHQRRHPRSAT